MPERYSRNCSLVLDWVLEGGGVVVPLLEAMVIRGAIVWFDGTARVWDCEMVLLSEVANLASLVVLGDW
jgi:hypothetical protein